MKKILISATLFAAMTVLFFSCRKSGTEDMMPDKITADQSGLKTRILTQPMGLDNIQIPTGTKEIRNEDGSITLIFPQGFKLVGIEESFASAEGLKQDNNGGASTLVAVEAITISCECLSKDGPCFPVSAGGTKYSCTVDSSKLCTACLMRTKKVETEMEKSGGERMQITHFSIVDTRAGSGFVYSADELPKDKISFNPALLKWPAFMQELNKVLEGKFTSADMAVLNSSDPGNLPSNYEFRAIKVMGQLTIVALNMNLQQNLEEAAAADTTINGLNYSCKCSGAGAGCTLKVLQPTVPIVSCDPGNCTVCDMIIVKKPKKTEVEDVSF
jgi:hypothetical protein